MEKRCLNLARLFLAFGQVHNLYLDLIDFKRTSHETFMTVVDKSFRYQLSENGRHRECLWAVTTDNTTKYIPPSGRKGEYDLLDAKPSRVVVAWLPEIEAAETGHRGTNNTVSIN